MKFQIRETVYALHFDRERQVYLQESIIIGITAKTVRGTYADDPKKLVVGEFLELYNISFNDEHGKYFLNDLENSYFHPENLVFKTKQEALLYLHGIVLEVAK